MAKLTDLLQRTLFVPHEDAELDPDVELSCYPTAEEALKDEMANFVTEVLVIRTANAEKLIEELAEKGIVVRRRIRKPGGDEAITGKQVVALTQLARKLETRIEDLIQKAMGTHMPLKMLTKDEAAMVIELAHDLVKDKKAEVTVKIGG